MRNLTYLNGVLTVLAVLLAMNVWIGLHSPGPAALAPGQAARAQGIPDSGAQRLEIANQLRLLNSRVNELAEFVRSGELRVQIDAAPRQEDQQVPILGPQPTQPQPQAQPQPRQSRPTGSNQQQ